jgi:hypothetical protein
MLYAVLCYHHETEVMAWSKEQDDAVLAGRAAVQAKLAAAGRLGPVARLMPTTAATTLRSGREPVVIDGPFAETKEQFLGFYVVDCAGLGGGHRLRLRSGPGRDGRPRDSPAPPFHAGDPQGVNDFAWIGAALT